MTTDEMTALEERLKTAGLAQTRVARLVDAVGKLRSNAIDGMMVGFSNERSQLSYFTPMDPNPNRVCWANDEPDLREEFRLAIIAVLEKRLNEATAAFEEI